MKSLFSLDHQLSSFVEPLPADTAIIRSRPLSRVHLIGGEIVEALTMSGDVTLSAACRQLAAFIRSDENKSRMVPRCVLVENQDGSDGLVPLAALLSLLAEAAENQAVLLDTLLDTMSEATTIVDRDNQVVYWNRAAESIYEISREDVVGTPLDRHFASESIRLKDALANGTTVQRAYHIPRPDTHVLINSSPVKRGGEIIGAISIEQDITELVRLNEELEHATTHLHNLQQEMHRYQATDDPFFSIKGHSAALQATIQVARKVAQTDATVLLYGESGVGKELFARAIHQASRRHDQPFIAINCGAIPASLFESELFGYQGGAFTGAEKRGKPGKLELADGGTLFLDEVGELPLELQVKLLRALQERQFYRVGGTEPITVNTRIVAATNRRLEQLVAEGRFREDLYYRLNVFTLEIPPLRERREDIAELVQLFLQEASALHGQPVPRISTEVMQALLAYPWPGNVRELKNTMERLSILQENGVILAEHLPSQIRTHSAVSPLSAVYSAPSVSRRLPFADTSPDSVFPYGSVSPSAADERTRIIAALDRTYGNKKAAAQLLGISRGTLYNKLRKYGLLIGENERGGERER
ncbi:MAG: sigma 54-interacting transcriptional regulator [Brevibacillus sp.]|nr:sigma 54-interacting transcriptional regulator [Brevibacillus sp.]